MNKEKYMTLIKEALLQTTSEEKDITEITDLIADQIVDSLDSALFLVELEKLTNVSIPQADVTERNLMIVSNLVSYLNEKQA